MMRRFFQCLFIVTLVLFLGACKKDDVKIGTAYYATSDDGGMKVATVVLQGDKIVAVSLDELYFFNEEDNAKEITGGNGRLANGYAEGKVLGSKRENTEIYTESMKRAGSKQQISESYDAIEKFCVGKTVKELEDVINKIKNSDKEDGWDVISGSTLTGNQGYLESIVKAANAAK